MHLLRGRVERKTKKAVVLQREMAFELVRQKAITVKPGLTDPLLEYCLDEIRGYYLSLNCKGNDVRYGLYSEGSISIRGWLVVAG